jgi:hypothetical protein
MGMPSGRTGLYFDLLDGFAQPGCAICRYALRAVERFFDALTYENTNDPAVRRGIRAARGFCNRHTQQYLGFGDELGAAIIYRDLLHTIIPALGEATPDGLSAVAGALTDPDGDRQAERALRALAPEDVCYACQRQRESEDHYLATLLQHLGAKEFAAAYEQSSGLCAVHFEHALRASRDGGRRDLVARVQRRCWQALLDRVEQGAPDEVTLREALTVAVGGKGIRP